MLGKKGLREINQIGNDTVVGVRPKACKLKAVACFPLFALTRSCVLDGVEAGAVGIVLGVGAVGDDKKLHILKKAAARPKGVALIAVNLVKGFPDGDAAAFELYMYHRQTIDKDGHIIAVVIPGPVFFTQNILVDDLQAVVVNVLFIKKKDVFRGTVVPF